MSLPIRAALEKQKNKYKCVSHYIVGKTIGEGTFGKVKKGIHKLTGVKVNSPFTLENV
jgi:hypothetical protein